MKTSATRQQQQQLLQQLLYGFLQTQSLCSDIRLLCCTDYTPGSADECAIYCSKLLVFVQKGLGLLWEWVVCSVQKAARPPLLPPTRLSVLKPQPMSGWLGQNPSKCLTQFFVILRQKIFLSLHSCRSKRILQFLPVCKKCRPFVRPFFKVRRQSCCCCCYIFSSLSYQVGNTHSVFISLLQIHSEANPDCKFIGRCTLLQNRRLRRLVLHQGKYKLSGRVSTC